MSTSVSQQRDILRLAVPAFLALVAEPLFLLADSAIVGHLGTAPLAGLGVASVALVTAANLFVFLAYGTTSVVARQLGAGSERAAVGAGIDGLWLALALGVPTAALVAVCAAPICGLFGASPDALAQAVTYLRVSAAGIPAMLVVLAVTGVLRGLQDTRTPLLASVIGFGANIALNLVLVYGLGLGIAGSALGTVLAQTGMAAALVAVVTRRARALDARLRPHPGRVLRAATDGLPLLVRTVALRAVFVVTTWVAAGLGDVPVAAYQVSVTVWSFLAFALDALAIAGQALTGKALGAGDVASARSATRTMTWWGVLGGAVLGAVAGRRPAGRARGLPAPGALGACLADGAAGRFRHGRHPGARRLRALVGGGGLHADARAGPGVAGPRRRLAGDRRRALTSVRRAGARGGHALAEPRRWAPALLAHREQP